MHSLAAWNIYIISVRVGTNSKDTRQLYQKACQSFSEKNNFYSYIWFSESVLAINIQSLILGSVIIILQIYG